MATTLPTLITLQHNDDPDGKGLVTLQVEEEGDYHWTGQVQRAGHLSPPMPFSKIYWHLPEGVEEREEGEAV